jgi:hypothetical protein
MSAPQVSLPEACRADFGIRPVAASHALHETDLFADAALADLLRTPRTQLSVFSQDGKALNHSQVAQLPTDGAELLGVVQTERLRLRIANVEAIDERYRRSIRSLCEQLSTAIPEFFPLTARATLHISARATALPYRADAQASIVCQARGRQRIWIYPALDEGYSSKEHIEDIIAGVSPGNLPYRDSIDADAWQYDLKAGEWITWPQNAPYRILATEDLNVCLTTEYVTPATLNRERLFLANRFLRKRFHARNLSIDPSGPAAASKVVFYQALRKLGLDGAHTAQRNADQTAGLK